MITAPWWLLAYAAVGTATAGYFAGMDSVYPAPDRRRRLIAAAETSVIGTFWFGAVAAVVIVRWRDWRADRETRTGE